MSFHQWQIREIYSSADGTVQYIELYTEAEGQTDLGGQTLRFTEAGTGNVTEYFISAFLPEDTAGRTFLIGTGSYALRFDVPDPDYVLPDGFLSLAGGTLEIVGGDSLAYGAGELPADGTHSLVDLNAGGEPLLAVEVNSPTNFAGETGSIEAGREIVGTEGDDVLAGGAGDDSLFGLGGDDTLEGGLGDDLLDGGAGSDTAEYSTHFASLFADLAAGTVSDGFDTDTLVSIENLRGTWANDFLQGDAGANRLEGGGGDDFIAGGAGDDVLAGGAGIDRLSGGDGDDVFLIAAGADHPDSEEIHGGAGTDTIRFTSTTPGDGFGLAGWPFEQRVSGIEIVMISDAAGDTSGTTPLAFSSRFLSDAGLTILGNDGDNFFLGGTFHADAIYGNGGDDVLHGGGGDDYLDGGAGSDTYASFANEPVTVDLAAGVALFGGGEVDTLVGIENADGSDNADDTLIGDAGANVLRGLTWNDLLDGGRGADTLDGGAGADTLLGGRGADTLRGGLGNDLLEGGKGDDAFVFDAAPGAAHADLVTDFKRNQDDLHLEDAVFAALGALGRFAEGDARFAAGDGLTAGLDAADRVLYDTATGNLYYDADGSGAGEALLFATLQGAPRLDAEDVVVI